MLSAPRQPLKLPNPRRIAYFRQNRVGGEQTPSGHSQHDLRRDGSITLPAAFGSTEVSSERPPKDAG